MSKLKRKSKMKRKSKTKSDISAEKKDKNPVLSNKEIEKKEDRTLAWVLVIVGIVFASVLIPYFLTESSKSFEFGGIDWVIEDYQDLKIFHGRFVSLTNPELRYNVFFRTDPRDNEVEIVGKLDSFRYGGIISLSPEVDNCRGELSRVMLDLGAFLKQGVGVGPIESASNDEVVANESKRKFADCESVMDRTVVIIELGEPRIVQDEENPYCYTIYSESCYDSNVVEKFMTQSVRDFRDSNPREE